MAQKWTNKKLFEQIVENLRKNDELPDILEYHMPAYFEKEITTYEDECLGSLYFGESKGIRVRMYLEGHSDFIPLGILKTLRNDKESWDVMGKFMIEFQWECMRFIQEHLDEFEISENEK